MNFIQEPEEKSIEIAASCSADLVATLVGEALRAISPVCLDLVQFNKGEHCSNHFSLEAYSGLAFIVAAIQDQGLDELNAITVAPEHPD
jgi:hypothetical protein